MAKQTSSKPADMDHSTDQSAADADNGRVKLPMFLIYRTVKKTEKTPSARKLLTATRAYDAEDAARIGRMMLAEMLGGKIIVESASN